MKTRTDNVIAEGEVTGHVHAVMGDEVSVLGDSSDRSFVAPHGATIVHEEHEELTVLPGSYRTGIVREMDHFAEQIRLVAD